MHCRKNQNTLSPTERSRYVSAVLALKANGTYDKYVNDHRNFMVNAHRGPAFFPWHREFLRRFEADLRSIDSSVTLPYWDWTVDNSALSAIWADDFMGPNGRPSDGHVMSGPFAFSGGAWTLVVDGPALRRRFAVGTASLPSGSDKSAALGITPYDVSPYNDDSSLGGFRNRLEGWFSGPQLHNRVHVWVGGSMGPASSPNDPVFFLHHCFVDKLWADWQRLNPGQGYLPVSGGPAGHNLNDGMQPWAGLGQTVTPGSLLDHHALGYAYDTEAICYKTLKFIDDGPVTLKFIDDGNVTLKFIDDGPVTLKFADDGGGTLKFVDDNPGTLKFADDGGTNPQIDLLKLPALDKMPSSDGWTPGVLGDPNPLRANPSTGSAPFVLATPHHSLAWTNSFPGALRARIAHLDASIVHYQSTLQRVTEAARAGSLSDADTRQAESLFAEYQALLAERRQLGECECG